MLVYEGSIEDVLRSGEDDQGDLVVITYDELFDLQQQLVWLLKVTPIIPATREYIERGSNRPLHPLLGGKSPYSEFLPL